MDGSQLKYLKIGQNYFRLNDSTPIQYHLYYIDKGEPDVK